MLGLVQRVQHEAIAAQRHDHVGLFHRDIAIAPDQRGAGRLRNWRPAGRKSDLERHKFPIHVNFP